MTVFTESEIAVNLAEFHISLINPKPVNLHTFPSDFTAAA
jgi:hypothetical protein